MSPPRDQAAPSGVHATARAKSGRNPADAETPCDTPATSGPSRISGTIKTTPLTSLKRRDAARLAVAVVATLDSTMHVSTPRTAPSSAARAGRTPRDQVPTVASATRAVAPPGTPISPPNARPVRSCRMGTANVVNRAGSRVMSVAETATGMMPQPRTAAAPTSTTTVCASSLPSCRSISRATTSTPTSPSAYRPPTIRPTSCHGLRRRLLRRSVSLSLRRCATIPGLPSGCARPRAGQTGPPGKRRPGLRPRCRPRAPVPRQPRRRGRTCAGRGP